MADNKIYGTSQEALASAMQHKILPETDYPYIQIYKHIKDHKNCMILIQNNGDTYLNNTSSDEMMRAIESGWMFTENYVSNNICFVIMVRPETEQELKECRCFDTWLCPNHN